MSLNINWAAVNNEFVTTFLTNTINYVIMLNKQHLLGGYAFVEELEFGDTAPVFEFVSIDHFSDDYVEGVVHFGYNSNLFLKAHAYAPINPLQSTSRKDKRSRLHMQLAESAAPGYINVWACVQDLHIDGVCKISFRKITSEQRAQHIQQFMIEREIDMDEIDNYTDEDMGIPKGFVTITLNSFPIKSVKLSFSFDGSVLAEKVGGMVNDKIHQLHDGFKKQNYTITVPL